LFALVRMDQEHDFVMPQCSLLKDVSYPPEVDGAARRTGRGFKAPHPVQNGREEY
jgi:hypothetical protein